jgi:actin-related protein
MGFRTVVMLSNDRAHEWENDPELGRKIGHAMLRANGSDGDIDYGRVVECTHADTQTLAVIDGYTLFTPVSHKNWNSRDTYDSVKLELLKAAADKLGFRLTKKTVKKTKSA